MPIKGAGTLPKSSVMGVGVAVVIAASIITAGAGTVYLSQNDVDTVALVEDDAQVQPQVVTETEIITKVEDPSASDTEGADTDRNEPRDRDSDPEPLAPTDLEITEHGESAPGAGYGDSGGPGAAGQYMGIATTGIGQAQPGSVHTISNGETLSSISQDSGIPVGLIIDRNKIIDPDLIYAGTPLAIPTSQELFDALR